MSLLKILFGLHSFCSILYTSTSAKTNANEIKNGMSLEKTKKIIWIRYSY